MRFIVATAGAVCGSGPELIEPKRGEDGSGWFGTNCGHVAHIVLANTGEPASWDDLQERRAVKVVGLYSPLPQAYAISYAGDQAETPVSVSDQLPLVVANIPYNDPRNQ